jgi:DNA-binding LytR/AlgR family response regulator
MLRLSRKYIININKLQRISTVKAAIVLLDDAGNAVTLQVSKAALRENLEALFG